MKNDAGGTGGCRLGGCRSRPGASVSVSRDRPLIYMRCFTLNLLCEVIVVYSSKDREKSRNEGHQDVGLTIRTESGVNEVIRTIPSIELANLELLEGLACRDTVVDLLEGLSGVITSDTQDLLGTTRVVTEVGGDVVDETVENDPNVAGSFRDLLLDGSLLAIRLGSSELLLELSELLATVVLADLLDGVRLDRRVGHFLVLPRGVPRGETKRKVVVLPDGQLGSSSVQMHEL